MHGIQQGHVQCLAMSTNNIGVSLQQIRSACLLKVILNRDLQS